MANVKLIDVSKVYKGNVRAVTDFNLNIKDGEFIFLSDLQAVANRRHCV